jgi:hypothetical protein
MLSSCTLLAMDVFVTMVKILLDALYYDILAHLLVIVLHVVRYFTF